MGTLSPQELGALVRACDSGDWSRGIGSGSFRGRARSGLAIRLVRLASHGSNCRCVVAGCVARGGGSLCEEVVMPELAQRSAVTRKWFREKKLVIPIKERNLLHAGSTDAASASRFLTAKPFGMTKSSYFAFTFSFCPTRLLTSNVIFAAFLSASITT